MTSIVWTEFKDASAKSKIEHVNTWEQLVNELVNAKPYHQKQLCPWIKLASFGDIRTEKDSLRSDRNVLSVYGVEGDYDGEKMTPTEAMDKLESFGIKCAIYSSPSSRKDAPRWRIVAPLSKPAAPQYRRMYLARINGALDGILSNESFTLSQSYYFGKVSEDYSVLVSFNDPEDGYYIDEIDALDNIAIGKFVVVDDVGQRVKPSENMFAIAVQKLGRKLRQGDARREMLKSFVASMSAKGRTQQDISLAVDGIIARYFDSMQGVDDVNLDQLIGHFVVKDGNINDSTGSVIDAETGEVFEEPQTEIIRNGGNVDDAILMIKGVDNYRDLVDKVCSRIRRMSGITESDSKMLADLVKKKGKSFGSLLAIADCREMVTTQEAIKVKKDTEDYKIKVFESKVSEHPLIKNWVYLTKFDKFYCIKTGEVISATAADMQFQKQTPLSMDGYTQRASKFFAENGGRTVHHDQYVPSFWVAENPFFEHDGIQYINSYRGDLVPAVGDPSGDGVGKVVRHIYDLFLSDDDANALLNWMAYCIQNPGKRILWSPVILGVQGDGKTTIGRILSAAMGQRNVKNISLDEIYSSFTGWAAGGCVGVIEEIRITGHSRHDVMNKLKPFITNERISVVRKGFDGVDVLNTQNYLAFTNHSDALVLDTGDRRWGVFSTRFESRDEMLAQRPKEYWDDLYDAINNHQANIRAYFMEIDLDGFNPNAAPAVNQAKEEMIQESISDAESDIDEVMLKGGAGVSINVVIPSKVNELLVTSGYQKLSSIRIGKILKKLGFIRSRQFKVNNNSYRAWVRKSYLLSKNVSTTDEDEIVRVAQDDVRLF